MTEWNLADYDQPQDSTGISSEDFPFSDNNDSTSLRRGYAYNEDMQSGLVGWWPLHDDTASDLSGEGNSGTLNGGVTTGVSGRGGLQAMSFDGSDDYIDLPNTLSGADFSGSSPFTISFWYRPQPNVEHEILYKPDLREWRIRFNEDGNQQVTIINYDGSNVDRRQSGDTLPYNHWTNFVLTYDGSGNIEMFFNSVSDGVQSIQTDPDTTTGENSVIGYDSGSNARYSKGTLYDFRIYDRALSSSEIQTLYEWGNADLANPADSDDGGVSYYPFSSSGATDAWGSNDGTVNGATYLSSGGPRNDGAYSFDGTDDYIDTTIQTFPFPSTISLWVNLDNTDSNQQILSNYNASAQDFQLRTGQSSEYRFLVDNGGDISGGSINTGLWDHITVTIDGSGLILFQNGEAVASGSAGLSSSQDSGETAKIAVNGNISNAGYLNGDVDDIRIYDRALSQAEVKELYRYGTFGIDMTQKTVKY